MRFRQSGQDTAKTTHRHCLVTGTELLRAEEQHRTGIFTGITEHCVFCTWQVKILVRLFRLALSLSRIGTSKGYGHTHTSKDLCNILLGFVSWLDK